MIVYDDPEAWARMNVGRGMEYDGEGSLILLTWSVLLPSLLHYPHTYPITAAPYLLVVLVDTKMLKQQQCELSEPANAHVCFLITYPFLPPTRRALLFRFLWPEGRILERLHLHRSPSFVNQNLQAATSKNLNKYSFLLLLL